MIEFILTKYNYFIYIILMMIGLWAMIAKNNLVKKVVGMSIFQTAIILFFISTSAKRNATIPILKNSHDAINNLTSCELINVSEYVNPLPHVLMLTAIVVGVATLGVALAIIQNIYHQYETIEEDEILGKIK